MGRSRRSRSNDAANRRQVEAHNAVFMERQAVQSEGLCSDRPKYREQE